MASIVRYQSILKYQTIANYLVKERIPSLQRILGGKFARDGMCSSHKKFFYGVFYKTNLMPKDLSENKNAKIIFFSMPSDFILSVISNKYRKLNKWIFRNFYQLKVNGKFKYFSTKYNLQIKKEIDNWQIKKGLNRLILIYEQIMYYQLEIEDFINLKLIFPHKKKRRKLFPETEVFKQTCIDSFKSLDKEVFDICDFQILF